jgi:hypothetical protein
VKPADPPPEPFCVGDAVGVGEEADVGAAVGVGEEADVGAAVGVGEEAEAEACAEVVVVEAFEAFGDDEVDELVHPAAATHIRSAAHIAIIAACFFIKVTPQKNERLLWLQWFLPQYIRFLHETSFHVTFGGYLPRNRALIVLLSLSA